MSMPPDQPPPGGWPAPQAWGRSAGTPADASADAGADVWPTPPATPPAGGPGLNLPSGWGQRASAAPQPGVIPLRPLGLDDFFTGTFRTVRSNWRPMAAISSLIGAGVALLAIPVVINARRVVRAVVETTTLDSSTSNAELEASFNEFIDAGTSFLPWLLYIAVLGLVAVVFIDAGVSAVVSRAVLGQRTSVKSALRALTQRALPLTGLALLMSVSIVAGYLLCFIPGAILSLMLFAAPSIAVLEHASVGVAYGRSLQLTSKSFWRVIGILLLVQLLFGLAMQVFSSPLSFFAGLGPLGSATTADISDGSVNFLLVTYVALWVVSLLFYPLVSVGKTLLYIDQRMRHEGLADALTAASAARSGTE